MGDPAEVAVQLATLVERIDGLRDAMNTADQRNESRLSQSETRIREDIERMDKRINGRITRSEDRVGSLEREVFSEKVFLARVQGAAEERERHGLPPDPLPPPVPAGLPASATTEPAHVSRFVQSAVAIIGALAVLIGAIGALSPLFHG